MKTFYSSQEIEDLARQGVRELVVDDSVLLTDLARQTAALLGIRLVAGSAAPSPGGRGAQSSILGDVAGRSSLPSPSGGGVGSKSFAGGEGAVAPPIPAKPRGCQHGLLGEQPASNGSTPTASLAAAAGGKVVDDLVGLVKQMSKGGAR